MRGGFVGSGLGSSSEAGGNTGSSVGGSSAAPACIFSSNSEYLTKSALIQLLFGFSFIFTICSDMVGFGFNGFFGAAFFGAGFFEADCFEAAFF